MTGGRGGGRLSARSAAAAIAIAAIVAAAIAAIAAIGTPVASAAGTAGSEDPAHAGDRGRCGPLSLEWAAARLGLVLDERKVEAACNLGDRAGASLLDLKSAAAEFGLAAAAWRVDWTELKALDSPAILFFAGEEHFVAVDSRAAAGDSAWIQVFDPGKGSGWWRKERLLATWDGVALAVARPGVPDRPAGARVQFDTHHLRFGMAGADSTLHARFRYRNRGTAPLAFRGSRSSCKCTLSALPVSEIAPGDSGAIEVSVDLAGKRGPFEEQVVLETNDALDAEVELGIEGVAYNRDLELPAELYLGSLVQGDTLFGSLTVSDPGDGSTRGVEAEILDGAAGFGELAVSATPHALAAEEARALQAVPGSYAVEVEVAAAPGAPVGLFHGRLFLRTESSAPARASIRLVGTIEGDVEPDPPALVFAFADTTAAVLERRVRLVSRHGREVAVVELHVEPAGAVGARVVTAAETAIAVRCERFRQAPGVTNGQVRCALAGGGAVEIPFLVRN